MKYGRDCGSFESVIVLSPAKYVLQPSLVGEHPTNHDDTIKSKVYKALELASTKATQTIQSNLKLASYLPTNKQFDKYNPLVTLYKWSSTHLHM